MRARFGSVVGLAVCLAPALGGCHKPTPPGTVVFDGDVTPPRNLKGAVARPGKPIPDAIVRFKGAEVVLHGWAGEESGSRDRHVTHVKVEVTKNTAFIVSAMEVPLVTPVCMGGSPSDCVADLKLAWDDGSTTVLQTVHLAADGQASAIP
jgi:hypothetical protein